MEKDPDASKFNVAYTQLKPRWTDELNLYEPVSGSVAAYLRQHASEDRDEFAQRAAGACQINGIKLILEFYRSALFSNDPQISCDPVAEAAVRAIEQQATLQGDTLKDFLHDSVWPSGGLFGQVDIWADMPNVQAVSLADAQAQGLRPYLFTVSPLNRVRWNVQDDGTYDLYQSEDIVDEQIASQFDLRDKTQYQKWTPDVMQFLAKDGRILLELPNPYGFIPATPFIPNPSIRFADDALGVSLVDEQVDMQKLLINTMSYIDDFHRSVNFAMFTVTQDTDNGEEPAQEGELDEVGNNRAMLLKGKGSKAAFVSPSPDGVRAMVEYLNQILDAMFKAGLIPIGSSDIKTHTSGATIRANLSPLYNKLTRMAKSLEKATKRVINLTLAVQGIDPDQANVKVSWPTNFSYESLTEAIEQLAAARDAAGDMSPTAIKQLALKMYTPALYNTGEMDKITKEINDWEPTPPPAPVTGPAVFANTVAELRNQNLGVSGAAKADEGEGNTG